jgi:hypothetical protein
MLQLSSTASVPPQTQLGSLGHIGLDARIIWSTNAVVSAYTNLQPISNPFTFVCLLLVLFYIYELDFHRFVFSFSSSAIVPENKEINILKQKIKHTFITL